MLNRAEWFLCFLDASRAPVRPSGPAVDPAEWLSVFLAADDTHVSRTKDALHHAERGAGEELASTSSGVQTQEASVEQHQARQAVREEVRHMHGEAT